MKLALCLLILNINSGQNQHPKEHLKAEDLISALKILNITADIIKDTDRRTALLQTDQKLASDCAAFEIGYLTYTIHEKYRRMVDKYNTSHYMRQRLYLVELMLYLSEIEHHYWEINHLSSMLHEVEKKYNIETNLDEEYLEIHAPVMDHRYISSSKFVYVTTPIGQTRKGKVPKQYKVFSNVLHRFTSVMPKRATYWPIDYGWEAEEDWWGNESVYQSRQYF